MTDFSSDLFLSLTSVLCSLLSIMNGWMDGCFAIHALSILFPPRYKLQQNLTFEWNACVLR